MNVLWRYTAESPEMKVSVGMPLYWHLPEREVLHILLSKALFRAHIFKYQVQQSRREKHRKILELWVSQKRISFLIPVTVWKSGSFLFLVTTMNMLSGKCKWHISIPEHGSLCLKTGLRTGMALLRQEDSSASHCHMCFQLKAFAKHLAGLFLVCVFLVGWLCMHSKE